MIATITFGVFCDNRRFALSISLIKARFLGWRQLKNISHDFRPANNAGLIMPV
jgi:hypothetical protein